MPLREETAADDGRMTSVRATDDIHRLMRRFVVGYYTRRRTVSRETYPLSCASCKYYCSAPDDFDLSVKQQGDPPPPSPPDQHEHARWRGHSYATSSLWEHQSPFHRVVKGVVATVRPITDDNVHPDVHPPPHHHPRRRIISAASSPPPARGGRKPFFSRRAEDSSPAARPHPNSGSLSSIVHSNTKQGN